MKHSRFMVVRLTSWQQSSDNNWWKYSKTTQKFGPLPQGGFVGVIGDSVSVNPRRLCSPGVFPFLRQLRQFPWCTAFPIGSEVVFAVLVLTVFTSKHIWCWRFIPQTILLVMGLALSQLWTKGVVEEEQWIFAHWMSRWRFVAIAVHTR